MPQFCPNYDVISKKKRSSGLKCWFLSVISMGPSRAHGPSAGPAEATAFMKPMGPGVIVPPCPPSRWPCVSLASSIPVIDLERVCLGKAVLGLGFFFCVLGLGLEPCVLDSTSANYNKYCRVVGKYFFTCWHCLTLQPHSPSQETVMLKEIGFCS